MARLVRRLVGTPPEAEGGRKKARQAGQPMACIPEAIYCSAPQIRCAPGGQTPQSCCCIPGLRDHASSDVAGPGELARLLWSLSGAMGCRNSHEGPPRAAQRKRSMSTPEQATVYAVTAGAGLPDMPALVVPGPQAQREEPQTASIPGPVSPPRYAYLLIRGCTWDKSSGSEMSDSDCGSVMRGVDIWSWSW